MSSVVGRSYLAVYLLLRLISLYTITANRATPMAPPKMPTITPTFSRVEVVPASEVVALRVEALVSADELVEVVVDDANVIDVVS